MGDDASAGDEALEVWIEGDREGVGAVAVLQVEELDGAMRQQRRRGALAVSTAKEFLRDWR